MRIFKEYKVFIVGLIVMFMAMFAFVGYVIYNGNSYSSIHAEKNDLDEGSIVLDIKAKGNDIYYIEQKNITYINDNNTDAIKKQAETAKKNYNQYNGISYSYEIKDNEYSECFKIDIDKTDIQALNILGITDKYDADVEIKFDKTLDMLEEQGYNISNTKI